MAALNFPAAPVVGEVYPVPQLAGVPQYTWDGSAWIAGPVEAPIFVFKAGDTMTGPLVMPADPVAALEVTTKQYVDNAIATNVPAPPDLSGYLPLAGGTMTGGLHMGSTAVVGVDLSRHLDLWGGVFGVSVTDSTLNMIAGGVAALQATPGGASINGNGNVTGAWTVNGRISAAGAITAYGTGNATATCAITVAGGWGGGIAFADGPNYAMINGEAGNLAFGTSGDTNATRRMLLANDGNHQLYGALHPDNVYSRSTVQAVHWMLAGSGSTGTYYYGNTGIYVSFDGTRFNNSHVMRGPQFESTSPDSYRIAYSAYGTFWRNDGATLYLMLTNAWDAWGSWNGHRPITVDLASGTCNINGGTPVRDGRLVFAADQSIGSASIQEPHGGAVITGGSGGVSGFVAYRWRYMQLFNTGWWTIGYA